MSNYASYYGRMDDDKPLRPWSQDFVSDMEQSMLQEMKDMEDRIKRHITECKREIIREFLGLKSNKQLPKKGATDATDS